MLRPEYLALSAPAFLLAITIHEFAHAYIAYRLGDPTAKQMGRLTLNPLPHLDLFGALALLFIGFGWAKPVVVDPRNLRDPRRDHLWIALAGPTSNLLAAAILGLLFRALAGWIAADGFPQVVVLMVLLAMRLNIILAVFNLLPLPPLDGFHILQGLVSRQLYFRLQEFERSGSLLLLGLVVVSSLSGINVFAMILGPFLAFLGGLFAGQSVAF